MGQVFQMAVVFCGFYAIIREILNFFLKKKIINSGHFDKADILDASRIFADNTENQKYPSLKWGLVLLFTGLGFVVSGFVLYYYAIHNFKYHYLRELLLTGIMFSFISLGFLIYFFIVMRTKK